MSMTPGQSIAKDFLDSVIRVREPYASDLRADLAQRIDAAIAARAGTTEAKVRSRGEVVAEAMVSALDDRRVRLRHPGGGRHVDVCDSDYGCEGDALARFVARYIAAAIDAEREAALEAAVAAVEKVFGNEKDYEAERNSTIAAIRAAALSTTGKEGKE